MITFARQGERLVWNHLPVPDPIEEATWNAVMTLAVHLALAGWPLIRSDETWAQRFAWCDCGLPEGLARKIQIFEAIERRSGFEVRTPRIPGLCYPHWDGIEQLAALFFYVSIAGILMPERSFCMVPLCARRSTSRRISCEPSAI